MKEQTAFRDENARADTDAHVVTRGLKDEHRQDATTSKRSPLNLTFARHELVLLHVVLLQVIRHDCAADRRHAQASSISWRCCPFNFR